MSLIDEVVAGVVAKGFRLPSVVEEPDFAADPTVLSSSALMKQMAAYTSLVSYAASEWAIADTQAAAATGRYKRERAKLYLTLREHKMTEEERKARIDSDEDLDALKVLEAEAVGRATLLKALREGFEGKYAVLSRELTRRGVASERRFD